MGLEGLWDGINKRIKKIHARCLKFWIYTCFIYACLIIQDIYAIWADVPIFDSSGAKIDKMIRGIK